jgi:hypothetical protein
LGVSSTEGTGNTQIGFLKARRCRAFKKPIFIMGIAAFVQQFQIQNGNKQYIILV